MTMVTFSNLIHSGGVKQKILKYVESVLPVCTKDLLPFVLGFLGNRPHFDLHPGDLVLLGLLYLSFS